MWRDGKEKTLSITVARLDESKGPSEPEQNAPVELPTLGLAIMPLDEATKSARNIDAEVNGALVVAVDDEVLCDGGITIPILEKKIEAFITTYKN